MRDEKAGRYKTKVLLTVAGIREDGHRKILGLKLAESEGEDFWVVGAFPNERSLIRLAVAILMDINEEWLTGKRYLDMGENSL